ncbi:glutathione S-transferase N-terminal domain-containing protein [bacterium]|nr:glutathione S-transferase N-terminal domain-containing protein [bacterium]
MSMSLQKKVVVFTTPTCSWCTRAKQYLNSKGIRYTEVDVTRNQRGAEDMIRRSGQRGVPVILVGSQAVVGFDKPRLDNLLSIS